MQARDVCAYYALEHRGELVERQSLADKNAVWEVFMYSVIRFWGPSESIDEFGNRFNEIRSGSFTGPDRDPNRFSLGVSTTDDWEEHLEECTQFVTEHDTIIAEARKRGFRVWIDLAIDPEEHLGRAMTVLYLKRPFLETLVANAVDREFTSYGRISARKVSGTEDGGD